MSLILPLLNSRFWPENPVEHWIAERRKKAAFAYARRHGVEDIVGKFKLDWKKQTVIRMSE